MTNSMFVVDSAAPTANGITPVTIDTNVGKEKSSVREFYAGKTIFMTGGTGFLGKVILEKLLRSCPSLARIYILIRPKKDNTIEQRMESLLNLKMFERLRSERPNFKEQICPIPGNIEAELLGISDENRKILNQEVNVFIHAAATVRFDEPLRKAVRMNLSSVKHVITLCKQFEKLQVLIHISTAYSNCEYPEIEEMVYPSNIKPNWMINTSEWLPEELLNEITPMLLGPKPNTYTFTKQLAECLLLEECGNIPCCIIRPSMISGAWEEPLPGWIDNYNGPNGINVIMGKGVLRTMIADKDAVADIIPVDFCANAIIAGAWDTVTHKTSEIQVYHCSSGNISPFTWRSLELMVRNQYYKFPFDKVIRLPSVIMTVSPAYNFFLQVIYHHAPALFMDLLRMCRFKKPRFFRLVHRLHDNINQLTYFSVRNWNIHQKKQDELVARMRTEDRKIFNMDMRKVDHTDYMARQCMGTKLYLLKDSMSNIEEARANIRRLQIQNIVQNIVLSMLFFLLLSYCVYNVLFS